jgi:Short C-terminal domain
MSGRDRRQRRRRIAAVGAVGVAAKKHHDAKADVAEEPASAEPAPAPADQAATAGALTPETVDTLKEMGELHDQNVLSDEEFAAEKAKLLGTTS